MELKLYDQLNDAEQALSGRSTAVRVIVSDLAKVEAETDNFVKNRHYRPRQICYSP